METLITTSKKQPLVSFLLSFLGPLLYLQSKQCITAHITLHHECELEDWLWLCQLSKRRPCSPPPHWD